MEGISKLHTIKSIIIKNNEVNKKTTDALQTLMQREFPKNVEELRFINCKMGSLTSSIICKQIAKNCFLRKLSLV